MYEHVCWLFQIDDFGRPQNVSASDGSLGGVYLKNLFLFEPKHQKYKWYYNMSMSKIINNTNLIAYKLMVNVEYLNC